MNNDEAKAKRLELKKEIEQLNSKIGNPTAYTLADHQPYNDSPMHALDKVKVGKLLEEYRALPNVQFKEDAITVKKYLSYSNGRYTLKYVAEKDRWDMYDGTQYMTSNVKFLDENMIEVTNTTISSDNYGEPVDHIYTLKVAPSVDSTIENSKPLPSKQPTKEEPKTGISKRLKFQSKEELEKDKRQLTNKEEKQRRKLF